MEDQLVELVTAKLAQEKGFNWKVKNQWLLAVNNTLIEESFKEYTITPYKHGIARPTQSLLQKWLREVHNIDIVIYTSADDKPVYFYDFKTLTQMEYIKKFQNKVKWFDTYELALEDAFKIALKKIK